ncbi:MAG: hypothetical protein NZ529_11530 [Cytophagaceae bacterium]|nr:hypothetical protein [Cytophagaceae bacterium]MDW8457415.1 hypothetical protein [Cytophagaceae bacterium]
MKFMILSVLLLSLLSCGPKLVNKETYKKAMKREKANKKNLKKRNVM